MIASDKKVGRAHYKQGKAASPKLAEAAKDVIECRRLLSIEKKQNTKRQYSYYEVRGISKGS